MKHLEEVAKLSPPGLDHPAVEAKRIAFQNFAAVDHMRLDHEESMVGCFAMGVTEPEAVEHHVARAVEGEHVIGDIHVAVVVDPLRADMVAIVAEPIIVHGVFSSVLALSSKAASVRDMLAGALGWLGLHGKAVLAAGVFLGLAIPALAALFRPLLTPSVVLLLALTLLRMDWTVLAPHLRRPARALLLVIWLLGASPALMAFATGIAGLPAGLAEAMLLWSASPPLIAAPALAVLLGLEGGLALVGTVLATFAMPLTLPPLALLFAGIELGLDVWTLFARLALLTFGALVIALLGRRVFGAAAIAAHPQRIDGAIVLTLLIFAVAAMDGITAAAIEEPFRVGGFVAAAFAANLSFQVLGAAVFARLPRRTTLALGVTSGNRNLAVLVGSLGAAVPPDVFLYFAVGQLPIYLLPGLLAPIYRRLAAVQR